MSKTTYKNLTDELGKYSQAQYPYEACGLITKEFKFISSNNLSAKPKSSFVIDPLLLIEHDENIWGVFHSHPDENYQEPSEADLQMLIYEDLKFILGINDKFYIYWYDKNKKMKRFEKLNENHFEHN